MHPVWCWALGNTNHISLWGFEIPLLQNVCCQSTTKSSVWRLLGSPFTLHTQFQATPSGFGAVFYCDFHFADWFLWSLCTSIPVQVLFIPAGLLLGHQWNPSAWFSQGLQGLLFNDFRIGLPGAVEKMKYRKIIMGLLFSSNTENNKNKQSIGQDLHQS